MPVDISPYPGAEQKRGVDDRGSYSKPTRTRPMALIRLIFNRLYIYNMWMWKDSDRIMLCADCSAWR